MKHTRPLTAVDLAEVAVWRRSTHSDGAGGNCVEVADLTHTPHGAVAIRDSKDPCGPVLLVPAGAFARLAAHVAGA